jgi:hypothetical protein
MKKTTAILSATVVACLALASAPAKADTLGFVPFGSVDAKSVVFAAAGNAGNAAAITAAFHQNGTVALAPVDITLGTYGAGAFVTFDSVSGHVNCCNGSPTTPPDGDPGITALSPFNSISGISAPTDMFLAGVFTSGTPSGSAPATLNFNTLTESFSSLAPLLNQTFFIGDGLTGSGSGSTQTFVIPAGATDLSLGIPDGSGFSGTPSFYGDNKGAFTGNYAITTPGAPAPDPNTLSLIGIGIAGIAFKIRRKK